MDNSIKQRLLSLQNNLMSFACQLTSDRDQARDLLQDTNLKALNNVDKYTESSNFKGWLFTIMRNIFINQYRKKARQATVLDNTEELYKLNSSQESGVATPEGSYDMKEITMVMHTVSDAYRIPFVMYVRGYKYSEISEKMHLPLGTVKSRIFFARQRLKSMLVDFRD